MAWDLGTAVGGKTLYTWRQERGSSCGPACVLMVARLAANKMLDETTVRTWFGDAEGGHTRNAYGIRDFADAGSTRSPVVGVLSGKLGLRDSRAVEGGDNSVKYAKSCTAHRPGILFVRWLSHNVATNGWEKTDYAHWVVVVGMDGTDLVCLDPEAGVVRMTAADQNHCRYGVTYPGHAVVSWGFVERLVTTR